MLAKLMYSSSKETKKPHS